MRYLAGKERAIELVPHLSEGGFLAVVAGLEDERPGRVPPLPADMCTGRRELAAELLLRVSVTDLLAGADAGPLDIETDVAMRGRCEMEEPVRDRSIVRDGQVLHEEARGPGARIDLGRAVRYQRRPEETTNGINPRIEVVELVREVRGRRPLENVESDETDGGVLMVAGEVDVLALHDPHVGAKGQVAERALPLAAGISRRDAAIEVEDRRRVAGTEEIEVEVRTEDVRGARHRFGSAGSAPGGCDQRKPGSSECDSADACGRAGDKRPA